MGPTLTQANTLAIGTPGMSASPLLAEFTGADGNQGNATVAGKASATERPLDRLLKSVRQTCIFKCWFMCFTCILQILNSKNPFSFAGQINATRSF